MNGTAQATPILVVDDEKRIEAQDRWRQAERPGVRPLVNVNSDLPTAPGLFPSEALRSWPPTGISFDLVASHAATTALLDEIASGTAAWSDHAGLTLEMTVTLSGSVASVATGRRELPDLVFPVHGAPREVGAWVRLGEPVESRLRGLLLPPPRPAGLVVELALYAVGNPSSIGELLALLGADIEACRAAAPGLAALGDAQSRLRSVPSEDVAA